MLSTLVVVRDFGRSMGVALLDLNILPMLDDRQLSIHGQLFISASDRLSPIVLLQVDLRAAISIGLVE